jgi:periplasmic divalent cation tolerance protein
MDKTFIHVHWSCATVDEARTMARLLLEARVAACVQIIPNTESLYWWQGEITSASEVKVVIKSRLDLYHRVRQIIEENAAYLLPEITYSLIAGNALYINWLQGELTQTGVLK